MSAHSLFSLIMTSDHTVFLYVAKFGIIHLYQESNNSKYYNKIIVTRNVTLGAEHMHRK